MFCSLYCIVCKLRYYVTILIKITDFEAFNVYYDYLKNGGKLIRCVECGKLVLEKNKKARTKYCKDCANKMQQERNKENMRKSRATD